MQNRLNQNLNSNPKSNSKLFPNAWQSPLHQHCLEVEEKLFAVVLAALEVLLETVVWLVLGLLQVKVSLSHLSGQSLQHGLHSLDFLKAIVPFLNLWALKKNYI